jgi:hypothetical protein
MSGSFTSPLLLKGADEALDIEERQYLVAPPAEAGDEARPGPASRIVQGRSLQHVGMLLDGENAIDKYADGASSAEDQDGGIEVRLSLMPDASGEIQYGDGRSSQHERAKHLGRSAGDRAGRYELDHRAHAVRGEERAMARDLDREVQSMDPLRAQSDERRLGLRELAREPFDAVHERAVLVTAIRPGHVRLRSRHPYSAPPPRASSPR